MNPRIKISERFRPFVHTAGTSVLLPLSSLSFEIFPALIRIKSLQKEIPLAIRGPIKGFTVLQDLERPCLRIWGEDAEGFFRYRIQAARDLSFILIQEKGERLLFPRVDAQEDSTVSLERMSFGVTKKADWDLVNRRCSLEEILPFWFRLGILTPDQGACSPGNDLLTEVELALKARNKMGLAQAFKNLYVTGFQGLLCPTEKDLAHQGFSLPPIEEGKDPLHVLREGAALIREMLVSFKENSVEILPCLLPELHAGRFLGFSLGEKGSIDLEWSKKKIRRLIFRSLQNQTLTFKYQKSLQTYRMQMKGESHVQHLRCGDSIEFMAHQTYFFDRFEK